MARPIRIRFLDKEVYVAPAQNLIAKSSILSAFLLPANATVSLAYRINAMEIVCEMNVSGDIFLLPTDWQDEYYVESDRAPSRPSSVSPSPDFREPDRIQKVILQWEDRVFMVIGENNSQGSGDLISGQKILTAAHLSFKIDECYLIKGSKDRCLRAKCQFISRNCDFALLTSTEVPELSTPTDLIPRGSEYFVLGYPNGTTTAQPSVTQGVIEGFMDDNIHFVGTPGSRRGYSGAPVFSNFGCLVGVLLGSTSGVHIDTTIHECLALSAEQKYSRILGIHCINLRYSEGKKVPKSTGRRRGRPPKAAALEVTSHIELSDANHPADTIEAPPVKSKSRVQVEYDDDFIIPHPAPAISKNTRVEKEIGKKSIKRRLVAETPEQSESEPEEEIDWNAVLESQTKSSDGAQHAKPQPSLKTASLHFDGDETDDSQSSTPAQETVQTKKSKMLADTPARDNTSKVSMGKARIFADQEKSAYNNFSKMFKAAEPSSGSLRASMTRKTTQQVLRENSFKASAPLKTPNNSILQKTCSKIKSTQLLNACEFAATSFGPPENTVRSSVGYLRAAPRQEIVDDPLDKILDNLDATFPPRKSVSESRHVKSTMSQEKSLIPFAPPPPPPPRSSIYVDVHDVSDVQSRSPIKVANNQNTALAVFSKAVSMPVDVRRKEPPAKEAPKQSAGAPPNASRPRISALGKANELSERYFNHVIEANLLKHMNDFAFKCNQYVQMHTWSQFNCQQPSSQLALGWNQPPMFFPRPPTMIMPRPPPQPMTMPAPPPYFTMVPQQPPLHGFMPPNYGFYPGHGLAPAQCNPNPAANNIEEGATAITKPPSSNMIAIDEAVPPPPPTTTTCEKSSREDENRNHESKMSYEKRRNAVYDKWARKNSGGDFKGSANNNFDKPFSFKETRGDQAEHNSGRFNNFGFKGSANNNFDRSFPFKGSRGDQDEHNSGNFNGRTRRSSPSKSQKLNRSWSRGSRGNRIEEENGKWKKNPEVLRGASFSSEQRGRGRDRSPWRGRQETRKCGGSFSRSRSRSGPRSKPKENEKKGDDRPECIITKAVPARSRSNSREATSRGRDRSQANKGRKAAHRSGSFSRSRSRSRPSPPNTKETGVDANVEKNRDPSRDPVTKSKGDSSAEPNPAEVSISQGTAMEEADRKLRKEAWKKMISKFAEQ